MKLSNRTLKWIIPFFALSMMFLSSVSMPSAAYADDGSGTSDSRGDGGHHHGGGNSGNGGGNGGGQQDGGGDAGGNVPEVPLGALLPAGMAVVTGVVYKMRNKDKEK